MTLRDQSFAANALAEFHAALGDKPGRQNPALRITLHEEEHLELLHALGETHPSRTVVTCTPREAVEHIARELADVVYLAYGTAHAYAIDLDAAFAEVHRAAMSKLEPQCQRCGGERWVRVAPIDLGGGGEAEEVLCSDCGGTGKGQRVVRADGKVLKPPGFVPPDMSRAVS